MKTETRIAMHVRRMKRPRHRIARLSLAGLLAALLAQAAGAADVTDQRGHRFSFDKPAERAVFLPMPLPSTYLAIDGTERHIVGINPSSAAAMRDGILSRIFPKVLGIPTNVTHGAGFTPNIEAILSLKPDVVFQWASIGSDPIEALDRVGLRVLGIRTGTQSDTDAYVAMVGQVAGKDARAAELVQRQQQRLTEIKSATSVLPPQRRPRVLYLARHSDSLSVSGPGTYNDFYIRLAGGTNVAAISGTGRAVTIEQILVWDPEVILLGNFDSAMPADLYRDPRWQSVAAVKAHRVFRMPLGGYRWDPPSQESALTWTWVAGLLHPDQYRADLRHDMRDWYRFLYNHDLTDDEIDRILFTAENAGSAGYERYRRR
jgi:iron complex transport system substrate-binding protein